MQTLIVLFVVGLGCLIFRELRIANPIINFRVLRRSQSSPCRASSCSVPTPCCTASSISLPGMLQTLVRLRRLSRRAGDVARGASPRSAAMMVVGFLLGRGVDARWLIAAGLVVMAAAQLLDVADEPADQPGQVVWPRMVLTVGLGLMFAPINVAAYKYIPVHLRGAAVGLAQPAAQRGGQRRHVDGRRPSRSGASSFIYCGWASFSIRLAPPPIRFSSNSKIHFCGTPAMR